ncbi:hypothetical protein [Fibrella forsythiae]|uniref:VWA domain-containing protein n=1 Tax=Fibrella forsythiae TaxID=2817061 RepID=A0ABS3JQ09_9BACT|nr:hypothetical protein [Fibrella forsythiae]MBO0952089.1 hypothetical protein [Fibrella forsythiae]
MNSTDDKSLHDWVRQSLKDYQPAYQPEDWLVIRRQVRRRKWRTGLLISSLLLLMGTAGYIVDLSIADTPPRPRSTSRQTGTLAAVCSPGRERLIKLSSPKRQPASVIPKKPVHTSPSATTVADAQPERVVTPPPSGAQVRPVLGVIQPVRQWPAVTFRTLSPFEMDLEKKLVSGDIGADSTVFAALTRNLRRWPNAVVVCDLTTSMDPFAAQIYAWFRHNSQSPQIQGTVFYTDCDSLGQETRPNGPAGMFFVTREREPRRALPTLLAAARNTLNNRLNAENVVEALQFAHREFPKAQHLILIADNESGVKDMALLPSLNVPVHIIACDTQSGHDYAFEPDQFRIAQHTNGSLHTLDDDIDPGKLTNSTFVRLGSTYYRYVTRRGRFMKTNYRHRPIRVLGLHW